MNHAIEITDRAALMRNRYRAERDPVLFLHDEAAVEISERLDEINKAFIAPALVGHIAPPVRNLFPGATVVEDQAHLDLSSAAHDLVIHAFGLHWADDPIGQIVQSKLALVPDGMFLAVLFGGATLSELRTAIAEAEARLTGGLSPRVLPMGDVRELGGLLGRAGLALPVADSRRLKIRYPNLKKLISDLRGMGETNALSSRRRGIPPRDLFHLTERFYREHFSDSEGYLVATFELVFLTGWAPSESQQKPLKPGSARMRLSDALGVPTTDSEEPPE